MADEIVTIKIRINANTREIKDVNRELAKLGATSRMVDASSTKFGRTIDNKLDPSMKRFRKTIGGVIDALAGFNKLLLKVFGISFVLAAASLAGVNALFATGRVLVQAYKVAMQALSVSVIAVGAALATVAAAMREYNAALYAYSYKSAPAMEGGLNKSRAALRMLQSDAKLSVFGMEALNASFATLSRNGKVSASTVKSMRTLADFAAAGGDPTKNLQAASEFVAMMQKNGKLSEEAIQLGSQVSDAFAATLTEAKKKGIKTFDDLMKAIESGSLQSANAVKGQADLLGTTVFGQFKSFAVQITNLGADIGQSLLGPTSEALDKIFKIIRNTIVRLAPEIRVFGSGNVLDGLVSATQKLADFFVRLTREYLPGSQGMLSRFGNFWDKTVYVFERMADTMRPLIDGGKAVIEIFGPAISGIFGKIGDIIQQVDKLIVKNKDKWQDFGNAVKRVVDLLGDMVIYMIDMFDRALPIITPIVNVFVDLARAIMAVGRGLSLIPGGLGALGAIASMAGFMGLGMATKNWKAGKGFSPRPGGAREPGDGGGFSGFFGGTTTPYSEGGVGFKGAMAASLGMAYMSRYVSENSAGYVGAGSMLAGLTPMMGRYGQKGLGAAGAIAGLGTMWGAQTAGGGFLSGAMGGASLGSMAGLPGAITGAIVGGIVGFFRGGNNKRKKEVTQAVQKSSGQLYDAMADAMILGNAASADKIRKTELTRLKNKDYTEEEIKLLMKHGNAFKKEIKARQETLEIMQGPLERFSAITESISNMTGKSASEIQTLANELGVNLYDDTRNAIDVMRELGVAVSLSADQMKQAMYDIAVDSLSVFDKELQKMQSTEVIDDIVEGMKQGVREGTLDTQSATQYLRDLTEAQVMAYAEAPVGAIMDIITKFGAGGSAYGPGGMFEGMSAASIEAFKAIAMPLTNSLMAEVRGSLLPQIGTMAQQAFADRGFELSAQSVTSQLRGLRPDQFAQAEAIMYASAGYANLDRETQNMYAQSGRATNQVDFLVQEFGKIGIELPKTLIDIATKTDEMTDKEAAVRQEFFDVVRSAFANAPGWMTSTPPWWTQITGMPGVTTTTSTNQFPKVPGKTLANENTVFNNGTPSSTFGNGAKLPPSTNSVFTDDTSTPRGDTTSSRLSKTLSRHNFLNGQVAGRRSITSSFRTNNLGSINSDHVTGRAYDLVGQNLGAYSRLVNNSGGFAEFHGFGGGRHLHVVPGEGPMGDTSLPSMVTSTPVSPSSTTNNYNITVNGGTDSAQTIARTVMDEIARAQRSARERK